MTNSGVIGRILLLGAMGLVLAIAWQNRDALVRQVTIPIPVSGVGSTSKPAFDAWLAQDESRARAFAQFERFLAEEGVAEVVEPWQLARIDGFVARECDAEPFLIPPEDLWPKVLPALRLLREEVIPTLGPVEVLSSYRSSALNSCAGGAGRSNHLEFSALDLVTAPRRRGEGLYRELCAMHDDAGPSSRMGLGAYYDLAEGDYSGGRFHIDGEGYRTWGRSYTSASSPCGRFD
ncbi:D-Ala-D-Ala carboxypeptidase family metallohydrolase [Citromicrobium sp. JLT1363]|uniref:D-Ala-D-Ala carboxypeptidase family metallohydrolase n=1 Tax=Citromicrobium sp. JLT1363 TaxID=517722 RepID=UPI0002F1664B|nr:D-Ala-D-Ala carboxypeptidase family metallohydrolase [Citromicrobium sp. JLT1363]